MKAEHSQLIPQKPLQETLSTSGSQMDASWLTKFSFLDGNLFQRGIWEAKMWMKKR